MDGETAGTPRGIGIGERAGVIETGSVRRPWQRRSVLDLVVLNEQETPCALRALRDVVASNGTITPGERRFIEVVAELHGSTVDVASLAAIAPGEVAEAIGEPHQRKRVVQLATIAAMVEGDVTPAEAAAVRKLAAALEVEEASLRVLDAIAGDHALLTRFDMMRRIMQKVGTHAYREEGFTGIRKMLAPFTGGEDPQVAWKYKRLGLLPEGTLGREFWEHCTSNRFPIPGEKGGIPERMVFHDFGHVLAGYDTRPESEIQQGAFQGGFVREDGFAFLMFAIIQFHLGFDVTPTTSGRKGLFDVPKVLVAAQRGAACKVDLSDHWDPFAVADAPVDQLRAEYGIPALSAFA
jgi:tellurite resistance protein